MSRRRLDMQAESELARFLDVCFYSRLIDSGELSSAQRITDIEMQREGIDVIAKKNGWQALIDEKAHLYYINNGLPTFAFELGFLLDGHETIGWFLNDELHTDRYFLLWPNATTSDLEHLTAKDFTLVYGLMIKKKKYSTIPAKPWTKQRASLEEIASATRGWRYRQTSIRK